MKFHPRDSASNTHWLLTTSTILIAGSFAGFLGLSQPAANAGERIIDSVIATVDDKPITLFELGNRLAPPHQITLEQLRGDESLKKTLDGLILEKLLIVEAERKNIKIGDDDIARYIDEVRQKNNLNEEQFQAALKTEGQTMERYRERIKTEILKSRVASSSIKNATAVTDDQVRAYIKQKLEGESINSNGPKVHLRQILISGKLHPAEDARRLSETIKARLKDGEDFETLAKEFSEGPEKENGGDLGNLPTQDLSSDVVDALSTMKAGEVSYLITSPLGFQLFQLVERIDSSDATDSDNEEITKKIDEVSPEVKAEIKQKLEADKMEHKMQSFIDVELPKLHTVEKKF